MLDPTKEELEKAKGKAIAYFNHSLYPAGIIIVFVDGSKLIIGSSDELSVKWVTDQELAKIIGR